MSEQEVPQARDDLARKMPTQQVADLTALNCEYIGKPYFEGSKIRKVQEQWVVVGKLFTSLSKLHASCGQIYSCSQKF